MAAELDDIDELSDLGDLGDLDIGGLESGDAGETGTAAGTRLGGHKKKILVFAVVATLTAGAGAYLLTGTEPARAPSGEAEDADEDRDEKRSTPYYFSLDPAFVVNFVGRGQARFLQVTIEGLTRDPGIKADITMHLPHIRNNIVLLLSSKTYDELITPDGKENLRKEILKEVKKILRKETGRDDVENVYFTSFVMQ